MRWLVRNRVRLLIVLGGAAAVALVVAHQLFLTISVNESYPPQCFNGLGNRIECDGPGWTKAFWLFGGLVAAGLVALVLLDRAWRQRDHRSVERRGTV